MLAAVQCSPIMETETTISLELSRLVGRIRDGEKAAEEEFVQRFQRGLGLALRRRCLDPELAQDLTQDTLLLVLEKIRRGEVQDPERLAGFIHGTARNLLLAHRRKHSRFVPLGEEPSTERRAVENAHGNRKSGPLDDLLRKEESRLVRQLLEELAVERDRELLTRFYLSHQDKAAICADLAIDEDHFRRVLFRARERLKDLWNRSQREQPLERTVR